LFNKTGEGIRFQPDVRIEHTKIISLRKPECRIMIRAKPPGCHIPDYFYRKMVVRRIKGQDFFYVKRQNHLNGRTTMFLQIGKKGHDQGPLAMANYRNTNPGLVVHGMTV
jgi:hypothetical protein